MEAWKAALAGLAIVLALIGFAPYIRGILRGQVRPQVFSWVIWGGDHSGAVSGGGRGRLYPVDGHDLLRRSLIDDD